MKKIVSITSVLSLLIAVIMLIMGVRALTTHSVFMGLALFSMARRGTFMSFMGNILGIIIACGGFGLMGISGMRSGSDARRTGFLAGAFMSLVCLISLICSFISRQFSFGDILILALPVLYTFGMLSDK